MLLAKEQGEVLDKHLKKILNHTPKIQDVQHVFYSHEADIISGGTDTAYLKDEFGKKVAVSFTGGCTIDAQGRIIPSLDEEPLAADPHTYQFLGFQDEDGVLVRSDHTPEIPQYYVDPTFPEPEDFEL